MRREASDMAPPLRCWNCDNDLPTPPFAKWQASRPPGGESGTVGCRSCGWRYRMAWTDEGWQITEALRPGNALRQRLGMIRRRRPTLITEEGPYGG